VNDAFKERISEIMKRMMKLKRTADNEQGISEKDDL
jgi:hypothetical protein